MRKTLIAAALAASFAAPAFADEAPAFTANVGVVSDYVFRGITQTRGGPALQAGVDYAHSSGLYVGAWTSNVKWVKDGGYADGNTHEVDLYGGYKTEVAGVALDAGVIRYTYPGSLSSALPSPNTTEVYLGGTYGIVSLKYYHTVSDHFIGWVGPNAEKSIGSNYTDLTVTYPVAETMSLIAHVGRQNVRNVGGASYTDWKLGVTKDVGFGVLGLAVTGSDADEGTKDGAFYDKSAWGGHKDIAGTRLALSFLKNF